MYKIQKKILVLQKVCKKIKLNFNLLPIITRGIMTKALSPNRCYENNKSIHFPFPRAKNKNLDYEGVQQSTYFREALFSSSLRKTFGRNPYNVSLLLW